MAGQCGRLDQCRIALLSRSMAARRDITSGKSTPAALSASLDAVDAGAGSRRSRALRAAKKWRFERGQLPRRFDWLLAAGLHGCLWLLGSRAWIHEVQPPSVNAPG
jgi:hypothetical protein